MKSLNGSVRYRTAEMVTDGHPDKFCDQVADAILDCALTGDPRSRVAIECLAKDSTLIVSGEMTTATNLQASGVGGLEGIARRVWESVGYGNGDVLTVQDLVGKQSSDIAAGVDTGGAGDQGVMVGYATAETREYLPLEYVLARGLALRLREARVTGRLPWLRSDAKTQVTLAGRTVTSVVLAAQHDKSVINMEGDGLRADAREILWSEIVEPVIAPYVGHAPPRLVINGTGIFTVGGPHGDAGVVGRKIVIDAYGPGIPVGGGAYSGKDPTKVDRSAAYMARHIAKTIVAHKIGGAMECWVSLAFAIGQVQPEMVAAFTDTGTDVSDWVRTHFRDLSPRWIIDYLGLTAPDGWEYAQTAAFGHYGRDIFPWERIATVN